MKRVYAGPPGSRREKIKENEMRSYVVYRHARTPPTRAVQQNDRWHYRGRRAEACRLMASRVTVYRNQWLSAVPFSRLGKAEQRLAAERDEWLEAEREWWRGVERDVLEAGY